MDEQANILTQGTTLTPVDKDWRVIGAGDVNGDGKDDIIWRKSATETVVWRMNGNQMLSGDYVKDLAGNLINVDQNWKLEQTADWNGDGKADLFWRNVSINPTTNQTSNEIVIWLMDDNKLQSSFSLGAIRPAQGFEIDAIGDLDANGTTDVLWRNKTTGQVRLWAMNSQGKVATDQLMTDVMSSNWQTVGMNDVTGDGKGDILWRNNMTGQFLLWEMNGVTIKSRFDIQSADFTLNRSAISMTQQRSNPIQEVKLPQGSILWRDEVNGNTVGLWNFNSTLQGPQVGLTEQLWSGAVGAEWKVEGMGDMNGDDISDVLWRNSNSNQVIVWELNGTGGLNLVNVPALTYVDSNWKVKGLSDVDGDRRADIIWQNEINRQLVVWQMDGRQMLAGKSVMDETGTALFGPIGQTLEKVMDWDGDGKGDFFWRNTATNAISVWLMNGSQRRSVMSLSDASMGNVWTVEGIGDSNGNGRGEVLWRNSTTGEVKLWEMGAGNTIVQKSLGTIAAGWKSLGFADFTMDGKSDIAWRNGQTQEVQIWEMDGTGVKMKYTRSGAEYKTSRVAIGALQGKTISVPLSVSLTAESDTGISNSDGITKNRTPIVSGIAMPSATVTLYANNQIVGSTIAASNGQWSVTSQELADGNYELSASIQTVQGSVIQQKIKTITIDTTAPQVASVTGLMDGVAWDASDVFSGTLRDADNLTQLQYWINNGTKQTIGLTANASNLNFNNIALSQITTLSANAEHKLYLKAIDRAGNEMQYDYSFMRLNLPGLLDDANWIDPVSPGEPDTRQPGSGGTGGNNPGDGTGRYYIGVGGGWGYSSGSGGSGWNPAPAGFSDSPPVPNLPGQDPNQQLTYLEALNVILDTAIDVLSKHTTVASKKSILKDYKTALMGTGKLVEVYGLHDQMKTMLNSLFKLGYDPTDNRVSRQEAVRSGWAFAKAVALDTVSLRLKSFESQVYGMVRGMMVKNGLTVTASQETQLQGTIGYRQSSLIADRSRMHIRQLIPRSDPSNMCDRGSSCS